MGFYPSTLQLIKHAYFWVFGFLDPSHQIPFIHFCMGFSITSPAIFYFYWGIRISGPPHQLPSIFAIFSRTFWCWTTSGGLHPPAAVVSRSSIPWRLGPRGPRGPGSGGPRTSRDATSIFARRCRRWRSCPPGKGMWMKRWWGKPWRWDLELERWQMPRESWSVETWLRSPRSEIVGERLRTVPQCGWQLSWSWQITCEGALKKPHQQWLPWLSKANDGKCPENIAQISFRICRYAQKNNPMPIWGPQGLLDTVEACCSVRSEGFRSEHLVLLQATKQSEAPTLDSSDSSDSRHLADDGFQRLVVWKMFLYNGTIVNHGSL